MKRCGLVAAAILLGVIAAWASSTNNWDGWISDAKCAAKGANAVHAQCAKKCVEAGEKPVLVTDKDQKIVAIANPDAVSGHEGQHVKITGTMASDGALHVDKVTEVAAK